MRLIEIPPTNLEQIHGGQGGSWNSTVNPETGNRYTWFETADGARSSVRVDTPPTHSFVWGDGSITIRCCNLTSPHTGLHDVDYSLPQFGKAIHPIVPHCPTRRRQAGSRSINLRRP
jgi:hypothetical protein